MSIQHANRGIVKKDLQLYYNREWIKSFPGEAVTNYAGTVCSNHESGGATAYWVASVTRDLSTGYLAHKVIPLAGGYQYTAGVWASCGIIAGGGGYQPPGAYSLSAKVLLPSGSLFTYGFRAYPQGEEFALDVVGTGTWQTIKRENFVANTYNFLQFQMVRRINGSTGANSAIFPGDPFWVRDLIINSGTYAKPFSIMTNELSARPENTTNITNNANFASAISGTDSGGTQNGWTFGSWSGTGNAYATQASTIIYSSGNTSYSAIPLRVTRAAAGSMDFFSSSWNTLTNGTVYTISFWARSSVDTVTLDIVHQNLGTIKSYAVYTGWYKYTGKFTHAGGTQYPYLRHNGSNGTWIEIANVQLEAKSFPTDFTTTNRTNIQNTVAGGGGLLDVSGNNINANLTNVLFNGNGYYFDGISTSIDTGYSILNIDPSQSFSIEAIVNFDALTNYSPSSFTISNVDTTTNVITTNVNHNLVAGDRIGFQVSGGSLPSPLQDRNNVVPYYIISPTANTFKVSTSSGGSEVDITTTGSGTITAIVPNRNGMLFGRANYGGIGIYYSISPTNVVSVFGYLRTTAGYYNTPIVTVSTGATYLITIVFDELNGRQYFLYINGVSQGSAYCPSSAIYNNSETGNFFIGAGNQADGGGTALYPAFKGSCPMQRIYRRALTAAEVLQNFNANRKTYGL